MLWYLICINVVYWAIVYGWPIAYNTNTAPTITQVDNSIYLTQFRVDGWTLYVYHLLYGYYSYFFDFINLFCLGVSLVQVYDYSDYRSFIPLCIFSSLYVVYYLFTVSRLIGEQNRINNTPFQGKCVRDIRVGQIVKLVGGDIPADIRIIKDNGHIAVNELQLTGENIAITKYANDVIYRGTTIVDGKLEGIVINTGNDCLIYRSNVYIKEKTWLYKRVNNITFDNLYYLLMIATVVSAFLERYGTLDKTFLALLKSVILLLNTIVPLSLQSFYNMATWLLSKEIEHKTNTRINTHGMHSFQNVPTHIVTDKTGTMTKNNLKIKQVINIDNNIITDVTLRPTIAHHHNILACTQIKNHSVSGQPILTDEMEFLLLNWSQKRSEPIDRPIVTPFTHTLNLKYAVTIEETQPIIHIQGTPEAINNCTTNKCLIYEGEKMVNKADNNCYNRIIAYANKPLDINSYELLICGKIDVIELLYDFSYANVYVFEDQLVDGLADSFKKVMDMGLYVTILTGDRMSTAQEVGNAVGLTGAQMIDGRNSFTATSTATATTYDMCHNIVYRATPQTKEQYITHLKQNPSNKVLMIGDGANDINAIMKADIGVGVIGENQQVQNVADIVVDKWTKLPALLTEFEEKKDTTEHIVKWVLSKHLINASILSTMMLFTRFTQMRDPSNPYHMLLFNSSLFCAMIAYCKGYKMFGNMVNKKTYHHWIGKSILAGIFIGSIFLFVKPWIGIMIGLIIEFFYLCYKL